MANLSVYTSEEFFGEDRKELIPLFSKVVRVEDEGLLRMDIMYMDEHYCNGCDDDFSIAAIYNATMEVYGKHPDLYVDVKPVGDTIVVLHGIG